LLNNNNSRVIAHKAICLVALEKHTLSESLFPTENSEASFAKSLTYGSLRFYHHLNDVITPRLKKTLDKKNLDIHILMILGAYQLIYTDISTHAAINETVEVAEKIQKQWAKGLINAILRGIDRDRDEILNTSHYSHPSWLVKKIMKEYPDDFHKIFVENNKKAPMSIRVHPSINIKSYQDKLLEKNIESKTSVIAPQSLTLDKAVNVEKLPDFKNGSCYIQDTSAQLAGQLIAPKKGELILDACCAPGGKTTHLAELCPSAEILALDTDEKRLIKVKENIKRLKSNNVGVILGDATKNNWWNQKLFDKILVDAPCTGTGVIRRHPDIKLIRKPRDLTHIINVQASIIMNLWLMLKPGGKLVYATCSILKDENENQISNFIKLTKDASIEEIQLPWGRGSIGKQQLPTDIFDGFYYAQLRKK
tara:strand:+ start:1982 stop:3247 length:1266 start_codon:yes stop_codon:yes gene_type:complete